MLKVITKSKLVAAVKKKRKKVSVSWNKEKLAEQLSFDELRKLYASEKAKEKPTKKKKVVKKVAKKKVTGKKPTKKKKVVKKVAKKKVKRRK